MFKKFLILSLLALTLSLPAYAVQADGSSGALTPASAESDPAETVPVKYGHVVGAPTSANSDPAEAVAVELVKAALVTARGGEAQAPAPKSPTDWAAFADKYADKMIDGLGAMAGKIESTMKDAAPTVWGALVKKQIAEAVAGLVAPVVLLLLFALLVAIMWNKTTDNFQSTEGYIAMKWVFPGIILLAFAITAIIGVYSGVPRLISPEWYAIQDIINAVSSIIHGGRTCVVK